MSPQVPGMVNCHYDIARSCRRRGEFELANYHENCAYSLGAGELSTGPLKEWSAEDYAELQTLTGWHGIHWAPRLCIDGVYR